MNPLHTFSEAYRYVALNHDKQICFSYQSEELSSWISKSTKQVLLEIRHLTLGLYKLGIQKGDRVGILANSSPRWTIIDFAIALCGGISVPLFANISQENFVFQVHQTELKTLFIQGKEQWEMIKDHKELFDRIISLDEEESPWQNAFSFKEILQQGEAVDEKAPDFFDKLLEKVEPYDIASIVYTSGSTGVPKGVILTHQNLVALAHLNPFQWDHKNDLYLNILPLAHIFGRVLNIALFTWGIPIYYIRDIQTIGQACKDLHPTILVLVPRLLEKIYAKMTAKAAASGFLKSTIAQWAFNLANDENDTSFYKQLLHPFADTLVYSSLREAIGGKARVIISGGAALNPHLYHFYKDIGLPLYEGWGMTEASTIGINIPEKVKIGTVGPCLEGMRVKISDDGEILVKGPIVTQGYYKNKEATEKAIDENGWLHTGDKGKIDEDGYVTIIGRIKELYKLSTGKFIAPVPIEQELCKVPLIDMAMIIADKRPYPSALLFPDFEIVEALMHASGEREMSHEQFLKSALIKEKMSSILEKVNSQLSSWEQIRNWVFIPLHPTIAGGELTPTMKIRREVVLEKYKDTVESLYQQVEEHA